MNGIIALDIDGTVTAEAHIIPAEVVAFLEKLQKEHWTFIFITGRTFKWAFSSLETLNMPYYLAVQNGAVLLEMPKRKIVQSRYLEASLVHKMPSKFVIYSGYENGDICYYCPKEFTEEHLHYLRLRTKALRETWLPVENFDDLPVKEVASLKYIDREAEIKEIIRIVEEKTHLHIPLNRDPFNENYYVAQATHPEATKGYALQSFCNLFDHKGPIIAAGDDFNDVSMLTQADIKVVMGNAPGPLLMMADIIAPPVSQMGIISGLQHAIQMR